MWKEQKNGEAANEILEESYTLDKCKPLQGCAVPPFWGGKKKKGHLRGGMEERK